MDKNEGLFCELIWDTGWYKGFHSQLLKGMHFTHVAMYLMLTELSIETHGTSWDD